MDFLNRPFFCKRAQLKKTSVEREGLFWGERSLSRLGSRILVRGASGVLTPRGAWPQNLLKIEVFPLKLPENCMNILEARGAQARGRPGSAGGSKAQEILGWAFTMHFAGPTKRQALPGRDGVFWDEIPLTQIQDPRPELFSCVCIHWMCTKKSEANPMTNYKAFPITTALHIYRLNFWRTIAKLWFWSKCTFEELCWTTNNQIQTKTSFDVCVSGLSYWFNLSPTGEQSIIPVCAVATEIIRSKRGLWNEATKNTTLGVNLLQKPLPVKEKRESTPSVVVLWQIFALSRRLHFFDFPEILVAQKTQKLPNHANIGRLNSHKKMKCWEHTQPQQITKNMMCLHILQTKQ